MKKKVTVVDSNGNERQMYLQKEGSCVSTVSPNKQSSWRTEENVFNSSIKEFHVKEEVENIDSFSVQASLKVDNNSGEEFNTSSCSDDWESNCSGGDVPDYIEEGTAYFDEEGNYAGGTMADQSSD